MSDNYAIWKPEHDGHAPPNWREGMKWDCKPFCKKGLEIFSGDVTPQWFTSQEYKVPPEAINSPNDDDRSEAEKKADEKLLKATLKLLRQYSAEELAKHGITLEPPKDWATELYFDVLETGGHAFLRNTELDQRDDEAIALIRERVVLKEGV